MFDSRAIFFVLLSIACFAAIAEACAPTMTSTSSGRKRREVPKEDNGNDGSGIPSGSTPGNHETRFVGKAIVYVETSYPFTSDSEQLGVILRALSQELQHQVDSANGDLGPVSFNNVYKAQPGDKLGIVLSVEQGGGDNCQKLVPLAQNAVQTLDKLTRASVDCGGNGQTIQVTKA